MTACILWIKWENYLHIFMILHAPVPLRPEKEIDAWCTVGIRWYWTVAVLPPKAPSTRRIDPFQGGSRRLKCFSNTMCVMLNPANCRYLQSPAAGAAATAPASAVGAAWTFNMADAFHILVLKLRVFLWWQFFSISLSLSTTYRSIHRSWSWTSKQNKQIGITKYLMYFLYMQLPSMSMNFNG